MTLKEFFNKYDKVAIAFSGGVDSSYLLYAAKKYAKSVKAYYVKSSFQPAFELEHAKQLAKELSADIKLLSVDVLGVDDIVINPENRCYFCKKNIFGTILEHAKKDGYKVILDGTNFSDDASDRPGMKALEEMKVLSPLRICKLTKDDIRALSKKAGLFTWNKPAYACLATRIPYGQPITKDILKYTEEAENYLFSLGFYDFRVRYMNGDAKIQILEEQIELLMNNRKNILKYLNKFYKNIYLDLEVR